MSKAKKSRQKNLSLLAVLLFMLLGLADTHVAGPPKTIASSVGGTKLAAVVNGSQIYTSTAAGVTGALRLELLPTV